MASSRLWRLVKFFLPIGIILLTSVYLFTSSTSSYDLLPTSGWAKGAASDQQDPDVAERKAVFIQQASEWEINGPYNNTALHRLCASKKWVEGLQFKCALAYGGIGNIRNIVLTCVRYAIEAGATTILIPEITARDADLIHLKTGNTLPYTYMFDVDVFTSTLTTACPRIRVVSSETNAVEFPSIQTSNLTAKDLGKDFKVIRVIDFPDIWRDAFNKWLKEFGAPKGFSAKKPLLVRLQPAFFEFPILYDEPDFVATFGRIVQFRQDIRRLAAVVLYALDKKYKLQLDPAATGVPAAKKFYGAHLRTDVDAIAASFASYEEQSGAYLKGAIEHKLPFIYLASGSKPDVKRFTKDAKGKKIKVTTKVALLEGEKEFTSALAEMGKLTWDQQALIDFAMLLRSSHFGGTWASSFAYNIAFQRHVAVCNGTWTHSQSALAVVRDPPEEKPVKKERSMRRGDRTTSSLALRGKDPVKLLKGEVYKDEVDTIYGPPKTGIWFELSMWP